MSSLQQLFKLLISALFILCISPVHASKSGVSPTVLNLPSGPGSIGGIGANVQANLNMGLMTYPIKVLVPRGRGQATPAPSISYSSSAGAGLLGIGWSFGVGGSIERLTARKLPEYKSEDRFYAGQELVKIPGSVFYRARIEGGFVRYQWVQKDANDQRGYWIAEYPNGSKGYFGADSKGVLDLDAQVYGLKGTFRWELRTMVDRNGNRIEYAYFKEGSQTYLDTISWVFDKSNRPLYRLNMLYETRPDPISDGKPGFDLKTLKRIKEIQITSSGQRFRSYRFEFEASTGLSRLIKVTRYGQDGKTAHPVQFSMKYSNATFSPTTSRLVTMPTPLGINFATGKADFLDINGDGLADVIDTSKSNHVFHINTLTLDAKMKQASHDFPQSARKTNSKATSGAQLGSASVQMIDYNGDGYTDMVDAVNKAIYINKGNGQWEANSGQLTSFPVNGKDANMRFFDYNGDKAIDVISSNGKTTTYWVSDSKGDWKKVEGRPNLGASVSQERIRFIDINGDGLNDAVQILPKSMRFKKYLGYGNWSSWIDVTVPGFDSYDLKTKAQFNDINGDGMADMVAFLGNSIVYFVNKNGKVFSAPQKITTFGGKAIPNSTKNSIRILDINGNGSRDIVWLDSSGKVTYLELFSERPNLLREISNGIGQRINVEYGSSVYFYLRDKSCKVGTDKACSGPWKNKMPMAFTLVTRILTWASRTNDPAKQTLPTAAERANIQSIYYHNGFYDGVEKKFRGFRHVETLFDGDTSIETRKEDLRFHVGDTDSYFHGRLLERTVSDGQGGIFHQEKLGWSDCSVNLGSVKGSALKPPIRFICQKWKEQRIVEKQKDSSKWRTTRMELSYDGFGNQILLSSLGDKALKGDEKYHKLAFITPSNPNDKGARWILRAPKQEWRCTSSPEDTGTCAETQFFYDGAAYKGLPLGQIGKGNMVRMRLRVRLGKNEWREPMRRAYDSYGNLIGVQAFTGSKRLITYDSQYSKFSIQEQVQLGSYQLTAKTRWDYRYSAVLQSTNYNGHDLFYTYDTFGRIVSMTRPGAVANKPFIRYTYKFKAPLSQIITEKRSKASGDFDRKQIMCFDGLGRRVATRQMLESGKYLVMMHTEHNRLGSRVKVWDRYQSGEACTFTAPKGTPGISFRYDGLGRMLTRTHQDGHGERRVYRPLMHLEYDAEDQRKDSPHFDTPKSVYFDGLGRVIKEIELPQKGKPITTKYTYNALNVRHENFPSVVTFNDGSQKKQEHDLLGNVLKVIDPDRATTTYTYNTQNQLASVTDARGRTQVYTYDGLGRMLTSQEKDKPNTKTTYTYDTPQRAFPGALNVKGMLVSVAYPGGSYHFSYDGTGQPTKERHILMGVPFDFTRQYNSEGDLIAKVYPNGKQLTFTLDKAGRTTAVPGLLKEIVYQSNGLKKSWTAENGLKTTYTYNARKWPTVIEVGGGKVMRIENSLDRVGNITDSKQQHGATTFSNSYAYDALYRLTQANLADGQDEIDYRQNALHNIVSKTSSLQDKSPVHFESMTYDPKHIHQLKKAGKIGLSYDAAGYVTKRGSDTLAWDHLGRCTERKRGNQVISRAWYNNFSMRVIKESFGLHTFYVDDLYQIRDGAVHIYVKLGRNRVASVSTQKGLANFFDDLAPASGDTELKPKPDGAITSGDAWLYHAARNKILSAPLKKRPISVDLTRDMLRVSLRKLLDGSGEKKQFYHADHIGSIRAVTDEKAQVLARQHYYPYGKVRASTGRPMVYGYMNAEFDRASQTNRFMMRSLDPALGRWLSPDPMFRLLQTQNDEFNSYGMVRNNPIRMREILGTFSQFGMDEELANKITDYTIMTVSVFGMVEHASSLYDSVKADTESFKSGERAARKANQLAGGLLAASYALWGAASAAREFGGGDILYKVLNGAMYTMWAASEAASTYGAWKQHKSWQKHGKGGKSLIAVRAVMTVAVMAAGVLSTALDGTAGEIAGYAGILLFAGSMLAGKIATTTAARIETKLMARRATAVNADIVGKNPTFNKAIRERKGGFISRGIGAGFRQAKKLYRKIRKK